jgi:biotin operon repressor
MSYYWTTKLNTATNRRLEKLESEGVKIDTSTHAGRQAIGYNYLELALDQSEE